MGIGIEDWGLGFGFGFRPWLEDLDKGMELEIGRNAPNTGFSVFLVMNDS